MSSFKDVLLDYLIGAGAALDPCPQDEPMEHYLSAIDALQNDVLRLQEDVDYALSGEYPAHMSGEADERGKVIGRSTAAPQAA